MSRAAPATPPTRNLPIPRSAPVRATITASSRRDGATIAVTRHGPLCRQGALIEWVRWTLTRPDGTRDQWARQYTGANLAHLDAEFDALEGDLRTDRHIVNVARTQGP